VVVIVLSAGIALVSLLWTYYMRIPKRAVFRIGAIKKIYLSLLVASAALGSYLLPFYFAGINLYAFRLLMILAVFLALGAKQGTFVLSWSLPVKFYTFLAYLWVVWGVFSLFWTPSQTDGLKEVIAITFGLAVGFVFLLLGAYTPQGLDALRRGWLWAYSLTGLVALWEKLSGHHLPSAYVQDTAEYVLQRVLISTFGNPNNYSTFAVLSFPFLLWSFRLSKGLLQRMFCFVLLLSVALVLAETGSRLALIAYVVQLVLWLAFSRGLRGKAVIIVVYGVVLGILGMGVVDQGQYVLWKKFLQLSTELSIAGGSISKRVNLVLNGLWLTYVSYGLGTGAGSYEYIIKSGQAKYPTWNAFNPHNLWIEIFSQYGVWVGIAFGLWWFFSAMILIRARRAVSEGAMRAAIEATLLGSIGYILVVAVPSSFLPLPVNWVFTATVLAVSVAAWRHVRALQ
jgi:hypothetical protein